MGQRMDLSRDEISLLIHGLRELKMKYPTAGKELSNQIDKLLERMMRAI